jgi:hypothetical protein
MPFDESLTTSPQTAQDQAIEAEKRRKMREYQRPFLEPIIYCRHCQRRLTAAEMHTPIYRGWGRICQACRTELAQYLEPEEEEDL